MKAYFFIRLVFFEDVIINIEVTPKRGDCLGICGIARELAAKGMGFLKDINLLNMPVKKN